MKILTIVLYILIISSTVIGQEILTKPSVIIGVGPRWSETGAGFHLDTKAGPRFILLKTEITLSPLVGYHLNSDKYRTEHLGSLGGYITLKEEYFSGFAFGIGADVVAGNITEDTFGFRIGAKCGLRNFFITELAYQNYRTKEIQFTISSDIMFHFIGERPR